MTNVFPGPSTSRRNFLGASAGLAFGLTGLAGAAAARPRGAQDAPVRALGDLVPDPAGRIDLPEGFEYRVLSAEGERMDDGFFVPGRHDGMAAFAGPGGLTYLVRNHELLAGEGGAFGPGNELRSRLKEEQLYDPADGRAACLGGTTTLVYDTAKQSLERHWLSLAGTLVNCAGGATPWGTWISCEETTARASDVLQRDHGFVFEVDPRKEGLAEPAPRKALGRFTHEAIAVDAISGCVYLTEDLHDSLFYRFVPSKAGDLSEGKLQALRVRGAGSLDTRNWHALTRVPLGEELEVDWVDLDDVEAPANDLRHRGFLKGAARFARGEGVHYSDGSLWFTCTSGGDAKLGQVWRYRPSPLEGSRRERKERGRLSLFLEPKEASTMENCDNLTAAPFGHLVVCEDGTDFDRVLGVSPEGTVYELARNAADHGEFAGATFSPDGTTLFVNVQSQSVTLAITGPWERAAAV